MNICKGTIVFLNSGEQMIPAQNMRIELWDLDIIDNDFLVKGFTKSDGSFELKYDPSDAGERWGDEPDLMLRILDREYYYNKKGKKKSNWSVVASFSGGEDVAQNFDFGTLKIAYWEYENPEDPAKVAFTPRVSVVEGHVPQSARTGHSVAQAATALENAASLVKFKLINKFNSNKPDVKEITKQYPENLTQNMGHVQSRSDEYLSELVLNGFNPCLPRKNAEGKYVVSFKWDGVTQDGCHFAPNTTAIFQVKDNLLVLESIGIQKRILGNPEHDAIYRLEKTYTASSDSNIWDRVKRLFRVNYFAFGEVNTHLTGTHLNIEQYNVAIRRHVHLNPVARLLLPHFYGTVAVNLGANKLLITKDGFVGKSSALTPKSVESVSRSYLGTLNWANWSPRKPLCEAHRYAKLGILYWQLLTEYTNHFFTDNQDKIKTYWSEIHAMSNELIQHAVPYVDEGSDFYDISEINDAGKQHPLVNGKNVALSPVTTADVADINDLESLKQLCRYILFHTTFKHSWVNDSQYDIGGEIMFASLGVDDDLTNDSIDDKNVVPSDEALLQPFITYLLNYTEYGYIVRNEDNDMNPELIRILKSYSGKFKELGMDIRDIRSCINT